MPRYHVFLSHSSSDKPAVEEIARRLMVEGIEPWLDKWHLIPGDPWQPAIEDALNESAACAVFIGPHNIGPWQNEEMRAAINRRVVQADRQSRESFRVIPVLLPGAERDQRSRLPSFLTATTWVEFRKTLDDQNAFHRLCCGIRGIEPGIGPCEPIINGKCPYRGLETFHEENSSVFFGREALTEWLLSSLRPLNKLAKENRFLAIVGSSGSGKSSLARAGLVPAIRRGALEGSEDWRIVVLRPGPDPLESLAVALAGVRICGRSPSEVQGFIDEMRGSDRALHLAVRMALQGTPARRLVIVLDQFEEVFTLAPPELDRAESSRQSLFRNLLHAATIAQGPTIVVLTLRADFFGKCSAYPELSAAVSDHNLLVGSLTKDELRRAIERPAKLTGCEFEAGLVERLLADVDQQPGALPLLQHALLELWRRREGSRLTWRAYEEMGQLHGALEKRASEIYQSLSEEDKTLCRKMFMRLVQPGEGAEDTKRRVRFKELLSGEDGIKTQFLIQILAADDARLLVTEGGNADQSSDAFVEVAHEALIRCWSQLRKWVDADRAGWRNHRRLTEAVKEWSENNHDSSYLYQGARLLSAKEWSDKHPLELNEDESAFLRASLESEKQRTAREYELKQQLSDLNHAERMQQIGRLAAGVAHEVRNPLGILRMGVDYLDRYLETPDQNVHLILSDMADAIKRADGVILGLLDFSVPHALDATDEDLNGILDRSLVFVRSLTAERQIKVVREYSEDLTTVKLDSIKMKQAFVNIFTNAIDAMPNGGTLTVRTYSEELSAAEAASEATHSIPRHFRAGDTVSVTEVLDTGSGIPNDKLRSIFDPFYTTKEPGKGTGLGLTVTRKIIELHQGTISIQNRKEGGVVVTIKFKNGNDFNYSGSD